MNVSIKVFGLIAWCQWNLCSTWGQTMACDERVCATVWRAQESGILASSLDFITNTQADLGPLFSNMHVKCGLKNPRIFMWRKYMQCWLRNVSDIEL